MKATGMVRKVDELGRIVVPIELRRTLGVNIKDGMEIFTQGEQIILRKYEPACVFCSELDHTTLFKDKLVCENCRSELAKQIEVPVV
ncbi:AbrB/MazE/SpoVT family DNA-binding domain-containing protein [Alicyclobacillus fodiniaquatilis]|jgi:transcriptional pleiotropic regulator of transition state genes|uniref:AbrB/MazE/SpoVT family DNA-binding domain-containing protein n=1 Tax=Alicyclobacillus fodiniaquatilis TaxID=1661150 RepID=A0ABW4JK38_9BACL